MKKLKHLLLVGAVLFDFASVVIVVANGWHANLTISQHVTMTTWSTLLFSAINTAVGALAMWGLLIYIPNRQRLGQLYKICAGMLAICLAGIGWFPYTTGVAAAIHQICTWGMSLLVLVIVAIAYIKMDRKTGMSPKVAGAVVATWMLLMLIAHFFMPDFYNNTILYLESTCINAAFVFLLALNYCPAKSVKIEE